MNTKRTSTATRARPPLRTCLLAFAMTAFSPLLFTACATMGGGGSVVDRAQARWDAILAGDFATAYGYYTPGFRSSHTPSDFELTMRLRKVQFRGAEYKAHECEEEVCTLKFDVRYHINSPVPGLETWESKTTLDEKWIRTEGQWWYFPDD